ncbi:MAG: hypothetical protein AAGF11_00050 [Myxococcota bacterium]
MTRQSISTKPSVAGISRRKLLGLGVGSAGALALGSTLPGALRRARAESAADARFLFILTATGGASIIDSLLPVAHSEISSPERVAALTAYPDEAIASPPGSGFRCVRNLSDRFTALPFGSDFDPVDFVSRRKDDMLVMTLDNTSVNHDVAQQRSMNGDGVDRGRTIAEAMAMTYGFEQPLANCMMSSGGFTQAGIWDEVPDEARAVLIGDPWQLALATHGSRGLAGVPSVDDVARARHTCELLDEHSAFGRRYGHSEARERFLALRGGASAELEGADLVDTLMLLEQTPERPLSALGLSPSPELERLRERLPKLGEDRLHAQAALAFLLAREGASSVVTFGPGFIPPIDSDGRAFGTPLAFDFSHTNHLVSQNVMWCRMFEVLDGLIGLLQSEPLGDGSMWDQSLIYVATDFGRTKVIPEGGSFFNFSSGHDLNNGSLLLSPRLRGNRVYGGVDPETCLTYGFDPRTGEPEPGRLMGAPHLYSLIAQALEIDFPGRLDMSGLLR